MAAKFSWLSSIGVILFFFWIQTKVDQIASDWTHSLLFLLTLVGEVYVLWLLNSQTI